MSNSDSFDARSTLATSSGEVDYFRLAALEEQGITDIARLPFSIRVLLESVLRNEDARDVTRDDVLNLARYEPRAPRRVEFPFKVARVILQDFTGVPAVVDLAALRSAVARMGGDPRRINPQNPVDLVIDHSVQVDEYGSSAALLINAEREFERNRERYEFLRWGQQAFDNFRVVPPASGIVHQVNLEYLARVAWSSELDGRRVAYPDSLVGTDSHTTMINGLGVVGWGVGGIEAEAAMLGQPIYMLIPEVVGFKLTGKLPEGATATDLVLTITQILREKGVVGKFVEYFGPGLSSMTLPDRATVANMAPEYGSTMGFFPVDEEALRFLRRTGRPAEVVDLAERYTRANQLFRTDDTPDPEYLEVVELDLSTVQPALAGPKRPQDRIALTSMKSAFREALTAPVGPSGFGLDESALDAVAEVTTRDGASAELRHGDVMIAAITSCTNTSNPSVMLAAALLARNAVDRGLAVSAKVKTSLAPGSKVVTDYLERSGLMPSLEALGFHVVGYGCTTCIGNSGPLHDALVQGIQDKDLVVSGVVSGNRNFEGRLSPHTRANYLASPPLVVAYALAGTVDIDFAAEPIGQDTAGDAVYLKDIWPTSNAITDALDTALTPEMFGKAYDGIESSNADWNAIPVSGGDVFDWNDQSTYIQEPPFFVDMAPEIAPITAIEKARVLVKVGDSTTTDHISPAGAIPLDSPAADYLRDNGVEPRDFNSFGSRRGNDRVMTRGTFGNIRLLNELAPGTEGGWTTHWLRDEVTSIHSAAQDYKEAGVPTIVLAGADYGMGSSRDWAAKGTFLLGVKAVLATTYERIHRSNLIGMGVLPLEFKPGESADHLGLSGRETYTIDVDDDLQPGQDVHVTVTGDDGVVRTLTATCRIDTPIEVDYYRNGGILHTVLRNLMKD
jgi:aconitate hydratase